MGKISDEYDLIGILFKDNFKRFQAGDLINLSDKYTFQKSETADHKIIYVVKENGGNNFNTILSEVYNNEDITYNVKTIIGNNGVGKSTILDIVENYYLTNNSIYGGGFNDNIIFQINGHNTIIGDLVKFSVSSGPNNDILYIIQRKEITNQKLLKPIKLTHSKLLREQKYDNFILDDEKYEYFRDELLLGALKVTYKKEDIHRIIKIKLGYSDSTTSEKDKLLFVLKFYIITSFLLRRSQDFRNIDYRIFKEVVTMYNNYHNINDDEDYSTIEEFVKNNSDHPICNVIRDLYISLSVISDNGNIMEYIGLLYKYYFYNMIVNKNILRIYIKVLIKNRRLYNNIFFDLSELSIFDRGYETRLNDDFENAFGSNFKRDFEIELEREFDQDFIYEFKKGFHNRSNREGNSIFLKKFESFYSTLLENRVIKNVEGPKGHFDYMIEHGFKDFFRSINYQYKKSNSLKDISNYIEYDLLKYKNIISSLKENILGRLLFKNDIYIGSNYSADIMINQKNGDNFYLSNFSSGEQQLIGILNSIHTYVNKKLEDNTYSIDEVSILLDEPEISLHVDWQRKFIYYLINGINNVLKNKGTIKVNIHIATHSPFIISDLDKSDIIFLYRDNNITSIKDFDQIKSETDITLTDTFLGNIPELLRGGFFLEDQIGELGNQYISSIFNKIKISNIKIQINKLSISLSKGDLENDERNDIINDIKYLTRKIEKKDKYLYGDDFEQNIINLTDYVDGLIFQMKTVVGDEFNLDYLFLKNMNND